MARLESAVELFGPVLARPWAALLLTAAQREHGARRAAGHRCGLRREDVPWLAAGGGAWEKAVRWFGHRLHLIVDTTYELPLGCAVSKASTTHLPVDQPQEASPPRLR